MSTILTYNGRPLDIGTNNFIRYGTLDVWVPMTWNGITPRYAKDVWTDRNGTIYYSAGTDQYVLNRATSTWTEKTWSGLTSFYGRHIWKLPSGYVMYSNGSNGQYYLSNSTWTANTHKKPDDTTFSPYAEYMWTDGNRIFYNTSNVSYVKESYNYINPISWNTRTWNGNSNPGFYGDDFWSDNDGHTYYSPGATPHKLMDTTNYTFTDKVWNGLSYFNGEDVWKDLYGRIFYSGYLSSYSSAYGNYILDVATSTWSEKTWDGFTPTYGHCIWNDGYSLYYSDGNTQYRLT